MNKRRLIEWGKTLLILILAASALALSGVTGLFDRVLDKSAIHPSVGDESQTTAVRRDQAARPLTIMITTAENAHHGVKYNSDALSEVYSWFTASLGEALGSSGEPQVVPARQWESALYGTGIFFDYLYEQSVASLAEWLGVDISSDLSLHTSRRFCLAIEEEGVALYYIRALDGKAYRCATALNSQRLAERMAGYVPNGAMFAFEAGETYGDIDPYSCILSELAPVAQLTASNPLLNSDEEEILRRFGMNPLVASHYPESDGTQVFVEGEQSLRIYGDGRLLYSCMRTEGESELTVGTSDIISMAYSLAMSMPGAEGWTLQMSNISYDQNTDEYTVRFEYTVGGIVVCFGGRSSAMEIIIDGSGTLRRADFMCRSYSAQGSELPMPESQALAVVSTLGGGEPMLCYADSGESVTLRWVIKH